MPEQRELKSWEPAELSPRHRAVIALHASGLKNYEIAEATGYSESRISVILGHPDAELQAATMTTDHITQLVQDVREMIAGAAKEAFLRNVHLMRHAKKEETQQRSIFDILDRAGFKAKDNPQPASVTFTGEAALDLVSALRESAEDVDEYPPVESTGTVFKELNPRNEIIVNP